MTNPFTSLKEAALEATPKAYINREIKAFGVVRQLSIDTSKRTMQVELDLKGESAPISVNIGSYGLSEKDGMLRIAFQEMRAARTVKGVGCLLRPGTPVCFPAECPP